MSTLHGKTIIVSGGSRGICTAAIRNVVGAELAAKSRTPDIMADAAHAILTKPSREASRNFYLDDEALAAEGVIDFSRYRIGEREEDLQLDFWVDERR